MTSYFAELERELLDAARRQRAQEAGRQPAHGGERFGRHRRAAALALAFVVVAGVPAAAMTGVFRPYRESDGLMRLSERRVIAEGTTPGRGEWQLLASRSDAGFCFGIRLPSASFPGDDGTVLSEGCGGVAPGSLTVATSSGGSIPNHGLAFGMAPDEAVRVRVQARGAAATVETVDGHVGLDGRFYVAELPVRGSLGRTTVVALDGGGVVIGRAGL